MSRKGNVRLVSYTAAVLIVLVAAVAACHVGAGEYTTRIDAHSARAFGEAHSAVERLQRSLDACAYATDAQMQSALCTQLYADAAAAETALSALPVDLDALEELSRQISIVGDYAYLLSRTAAGGKAVPKEDISALTDFSKSIRVLSEKLSEIRQLYTQGDLVFEARKRLTDSLDNLEAETENRVTTLDAAFHELKSSFPEAEPLVYDGQFSDRSGQTPRMLIGKPIVSAEDAREAAAAFLHCDPAALKALDFRGGDLACWRFSVSEPDAVIAVTVRGGEVLQVLSDRAEGGDADPDRAEQIAKAFLRSHGYPEMECVESSSSGSEVAMTFVPTSEGVLCLPDRISMRVCSATEQVTAFDASEYLRHHAKRDFPETLSSWTPPETLSVASERKVVLLSTGGKERDCIEYLCRTPDGTPVCIDVNVQTGQQEWILFGDQRAATID